MPHDIFFYDFDSFWIKTRKIKEDDEERKRKIKNQKVKNQQ
jgi:hypothetical protein